VPGVYALYPRLDRFVTGTSVLFIDRGPMFRTKPYLRIEGWLADLGDQAKPVDSVSIAVTTADRTTRLFKATRFQRSDINTLFKNPKLADAGYRLWIGGQDVADIVSLTIVAGLGGSATVCSRLTKTIGPG
jgi:hypothetical protein